MRTAIGQKLINAIPEIEGRVLDCHAADAGTAKPYLVIKQGLEYQAPPWAGFTRNIEIWPYASPGETFQTVDQLADKIVAALEGQQLDSGQGDFFTCRYLGTLSGDHMDQELDAIARGLKFAVAALQPVPADDTGESDPWLEALGAWTGTLLGPGWAVYLNSWPAGYAAPSVLWRLAEIETNERGREVFEVQKTIVGHVFSNSPKEQVNVLSVLAGELAGAVKIGGPDGRYISASSPKVEFEADAFNTGQLTVVLKRTTKRPQEEAPLIEAILSRGGFS